MPAHIYVSIDKSYDREKLLFLPSWQPFQHDHPWPPKDPKRFSNGCSPVTIASPIGYNDLTGDGLDHFWECGCSARILQHPNASKYFSLQGAQCISKPIYIYIYIYIYICVFSKHNTIRPVDHQNWFHHQSHLHQPVAHLNDLTLCRFSYDFEGFDVHAHKRLFTAKNGHPRKLHCISPFFTVYSRHHFNLIWLQRVAMLFFHDFSLYMSSQFRWAITSLENALTSNNPVIYDFI